MRASMMLAVAALTTSAAHAQTLTYDQALRDAVANAPGAVAGRAGAAPPKPMHVRREAFRTPVCRSESRIILSLGHPPSPYPETT